MSSMINPHAYCPFPLLKWLHQFVVQDLLSKVCNVRRMGPGLQPLLLANYFRKAAEPPCSRKRSVHIHHRVVVDDFTESLDGGILAHVVKNRRQLEDLSQESDVPFDAKVLVADDGLGNGLSLVCGGADGFEVLEGLESAVEFKGHAGGGEELFRGAEIV